MQTPSNKEFRPLVEKSQDILILLPENPNSDLISSAYALSLLLDAEKRNSTIIIHRNNRKLERLSFLPQPKKIKSELSQARDFILSFNTSKNKIANVKTEKSESELRIFITPEKGYIRPQDFSFIPAKFKYDLVIVLGSVDKESLGKVFEENPDIFYEVPVINIDNHGNNEEFGQVNIINVMASSISEILSEVLEENYPHSFSEKIAQCLLTGIIENTESFQNKKTTPKSLQVSAKLMGYGANQQEIIRHLFKTQPLHILKLWGRVMAKLRWNDQLGMIWSTVSVEDFVQSRSKPEDIGFILGKIQENYSSGKIFMLLYNSTSSTAKVLIKSSSLETTRKIAQLMNGQIIDDACEFEIESSEVNGIEKRIENALK